ncbi:MAG: 3-mercaptopyruvate sulfurtransferase [Sphingomonadales bacterium]|nr:3-mercaptopyruvate sulfurtransferase [Sphingomonadales bacterium]
MKTGRHIVSTEWLAEHLDDPSVVVLDASWHMPDSEQTGREDYDKNHIPGALHFCIDKVAEQDCDLPHMLPSAADFSRHARKLGLTNHNMIVIYDTGGVHAAARAWWMFRTFSHERVRILDGGMERWRREGRPLSSEPVAINQGHFTALRQPQHRATKEDVLKAIETGDVQIIDARGIPRFRGDDDEPRAGVRSGHMPTAKNLPYFRLFTDDGTFQTPSEIARHFLDVGVDFEKPIITTCGSGVTACILAFCLNMIGKEDVRVYDGSWSEWGADHDLPLETGE